jgi:hypothetical protein
MLYYGPYAKFEDPSFDDFNAVETLPLSCYLWTSFFDMTGVENSKYLAFSYVLDTSIIYIRPTMMVHDAFDLPPKTHLCQNGKRNVMEEFRTLS